MCVLGKVRELPDPAKAWSFLNMKVNPEAAISKSLLQTAVIELTCCVGYSGFGVLGRLGIKSSSNGFCCFLSYGHHLVMAALN